MASRAPARAIDNMKTLLAQIEQSASFLFERAPASEHAGKLVPEVFDRLVDLGAIHAMVPHALGGLEFDAMDKLRLIESLAEIDASIAWVTMATGFCTAAAAAYLPDTAVEKMFLTARRAVVAGAGAPTGVARAVPGGFDVTGHWRYGSGILHADWVQCGTVVEVDGSKLLDARGGPVMRMCYIPMYQVQLGGNWDVIGLRATGSVDFSVNGVFVPEEFSCLSGAPLRRRGNPIFGHNFTLATYIGHSAWALGVGRRLLNELANFVRAKAQTPNSIACNHGFQEKYAHYEAQLLAARAFIRLTWQSAQDLSMAAETLDTRQMTMIRLALVSATEIAVDIANFAYRMAGGETLREGSLQRMCRDIQAGGQHMTSSLTVKQTCGRALAGLAEGEVWASHGLVRVAASASGRS